MILVPVVVGDSRRSPESSSSRHTRPRRSGRRRAACPDQRRRRRPDAAGRRAWREHAPIGPGTGPGTRTHDELLSSSELTMAGPLSTSVKYCAGSTARRSPEATSANAPPRRRSLTRMDLICQRFLRASGDSVYASSGAAAMLTAHRSRAGADLRCGGSHERLRKRRLGPALDEPSPRRDQPPATAIDRSRTRSRHPATPSERPLKGRSRTRFHVAGPADSDAWGTQTWNTSPMTSTR